MERGHELGSKRTDWEYPSGDWVRQARLSADLDGRIAAALKGDDHPSDAHERIGLTAHACRKGWYATAAQLWQKVFADFPQQATNLQFQHRWWAARSATQAGTGQGRDYPPIDEATRARLLKQALEWLGADLAAWSKLLDAGSPQDRSALVAALQQWRTDPELAGLRDEETLSRLSVAERQACRQLWVNVESLLAKAAAR